MKVTRTPNLDAGSAYSIAAGLIPGLSAVHKFGRNTDLDATEDVWTGGGTFAAPTQARTHQVVSTSTSDDGDPAGTGARTVRIFGLTSWTTPEVNEVVTMDGTTNVPTANQYVMINRMLVETFGASGPNVGEITATADTDSTVTAQILATYGQTEQAIYAFPSGQSIYLTDFYGAVNRQTSASVNFNLLFAPNPDTEETVFLIKQTISANSQGSTDVQLFYDPYQKFTGPGILKVSATPSTTNVDVDAGFDLILEDS